MVFRTDQCELITSEQSNSFLCLFYSIVYCRLLVFEEILLKFEDPLVVFTIFEPVETHNWDAFADRTKSLDCSLVLFHDQKFKLLLDILYHFEVFLGQLRDES